MSLIRLLKDDYNDTNSERLMVRAAEEGLIVSLPDDYELQLDIDDKADWERFERSWQILMREFELVGSDCTVTPSRKKVDGKHVRIRLPIKLSAWQRIALQASLGSDPVRELLSCVRLFAGDPHPTLLLEKPDWKEAA